MDEIEWMDQPVQQWQAGPGEGEGDEGAAGGEAGDAGTPAGDEPAGGDGGGDGGEGDGGAPADPHAELQAAIDAGIAEANGDEPAGKKPAAKESDDEAGKEGDGAGAKDGDKGKAAAKGDDEEGDGKKEPDPVNDPIPDEVKGRTRERMESLVSKVKETSEELEQVRGNYDEMMGLITETGATPEQYGTMLGYIDAFNKGIEESADGTYRILDQKQAELALEAAEAQVEILYEALGKQRPGSDPLAEFQDLKDEVETGDISEERALEIAQARKVAKRQEQQRTRQSEQHQQTEGQQEQQVQAARTELNTIGKALQKSDPQYAKKVEQVMPAFKRELPNTPPDKWVELFWKHYDAAKVEEAPASGGRDQPLRGRPRAGGTPAKAPGSVQEAIDAGIAEASQR